LRFDYFDMLSGEPIPVVGIGHLRSPFLREICPSSGIGYDVYNLYLNFLSWDKDKLLKYDQLMGLRGTEKLAAADKLTVFDVATLLAQTRELCRGVLSFFMSEELEWDEDNRKFVAYTTDDDGQHIAGEINRDNFEEVRRGILQLNFIGLEKDEEPVTHTSEHAKELWEKAQKFLKEQAKAKEGEDKPEYHIGNIISKVCAAHPSYNLLNIFRLTVFQLYDSFFQLGYIRSSDLNEQIFSNHGGDKFRFEDWLKPILQHV
jgi:hypothetical protein